MFRRVNAERCLGHLVSAVRAVTGAGASWAETVALGWRLANQAYEISGSQPGSQQRQAQVDVRPPITRTCTVPICDR